jgi:predicted MFS family arabinose efflux permease
VKPSAADAAYAPPGAAAAEAISAPKVKSEWTIILVVAAIQFFNILDFMMVMPLGPDFASGLGIPSSDLGAVGATYGAAAAVSGIVCSFFLDRFDRRKALAVAMAGLVVGTAAGGLAQSAGMLLAARVVAGAFGGPATSLALAVVTDLIPSERRGRAMGVVMASFSIASIAGVPLALQLAHWGGWRSAFYGIGALGAVIAVMAFVLLPPLTIHLQKREAPLSYGRFLANPVVLASFGMSALAMMGGFVLIPNLSAYLQENLAYPRETLSLLYLAGGAASFVTMPIGGYLVDKLGSSKVATLASPLLIGVIYTGFVKDPPLLPVIVLFVGFMIAMTTRNLAYNTLATKVPSPQERARFMSLQSTVQHLASAGGAFLSTMMLSETPDHALVGLPKVSWVSIGLSIAVVPVIWMVERAVKRRAAQSPST